MATECIVNSVGIEVGECRREEIGRVEQFVQRWALPVAIVMVTALLAVLVLTSLPSAGTVPEVRQSVIGAAAARDPSFAFMDHELAYAGSYTVVPYVLLPRDARFDALDHELARAGGYRVRPNVLLPRGESFLFLDHELEHAGGYVLRGPTGMGIGEASDPVQARFLIASACAERAEILVRFHAAKPVEDPANGALSAGAAAFYVAQYGAGDPAIALSADGLGGAVCKA